MLKMNEIGPQHYRDAMARFAGAVHVITTDGPAGRRGTTVIATCSVSDSPPTVLVCLNRKSQGGPLLRENGVFCVNTLGADSEAIADIFAGRTGVTGSDRFASGEWLTLSTGSPVLASSVIAFDCRIIEVRSVASHNVFFGAVETVRVGPGGPALVYHDRAYKCV